jgi:sarcosine oxidase delta subunit
MPRKGPYKNIAHVKRANAAKGHYFFNKANRAHFDSFIGAHLYGGRYFITSERNTWTDDSSRYWQVRRAEDDASISTMPTIGNPARYPSLEAAKRAAIAYAELDMYHERGIRQFPRHLAPYFGDWQTATEARKEPARKEPVT